MSRYVITFSKSGPMKYISHLDMIRLFKRLFKRAGIRLIYSQGFNPHPKMAFAQPLSLGYSAAEEALEFETMEPVSKEKLWESLSPELPYGIVLKDWKELKEGGKPLAALVRQASYRIEIPIEDIIAAGEKESSEIPENKGEFKDIESITKEIERINNNFLKQSSIYVDKRKKKSKELTSVDIKKKICEFRMDKVDSNIILYTKLDAGSDSNLSPELLLQGLRNFTDLLPSRECIDIERLELIYQ